MPVVSEPITGLTDAYTYGFFSGIPTPYLFLSGVFLLCVTIFIRRKRSSTTKLQYHFPPSRSSTPLLEKSDVNIFSYMDENPKLDTDNPALSRTSSSSLDFTTSPSSMSSSPKAFSRLPQPPPFTPPSPLEPLPYSPIHGGGSGSAPLTEIPPRRRSYTKPPNPLTNTPVVNGEIISGDGWRRHTRVFGGGISKGDGETIEKSWESVAIGGFENGRAMILEEGAENSGEREMKWMKE